MEAFETLDDILESQGANFESVYFPVPPLDQNTNIGTSVVMNRSDSGTGGSGTKNKTYSAGVRQSKFL